MLPFLGRTKLLHKYWNSMFTKEFTVINLRSSGLIRSETKGDSAHVAHEDVCSLRYHRISPMPSTKLQGRWGQTRTGREPRETGFFSSKIITIMQMASGFLEVHVLPTHALIIFHELVNPFLKTHKTTAWGLLSSVWIDGFVVQVQIHRVFSYWVTSWFASHLFSKLWEVFWVLICYLHFLLSIICKYIRLPHFSISRVIEENIN